MNDLVWPKPFPPRDCTLERLPQIGDKAIEHKHYSASIEGLSSGVNTP